MPISSLLRSTVLLALAGPVAAPAPASAACRNQDMLPSRASELADVEDAVLCLLNEERVVRGRQGLTSDSRLARAATGHAEDLVERRYFAHRSLGGADVVDRLRRAGYGSSSRSWSFGEVLAWGTLSRSRPAALVESWMASSAHKQAILEPSFDEAGVGAAFGNPRRRGDGGVTVATNFGRLATRG